MPVFVVPLIAGVFGFGAGWFTSDGTSKLVKYAVIGGIAYFLIATPNGQKLVSKVL
ncbi:hypothetical protein [Pseudemcibacter aquimaris]|uniref:hypothetical protein n=1 Tax=Pseudemcibacter aquimaris TaxID=2857064 RepID=UPI002011D89A|nr:hypothetical protein [Pseudemcibacter aquimaris]MCC3859777.1 hypothetical protein [Pseudemcibacter aquimaris]WDU60171.1 hypothetical protein KW060_07860 [Pseudemcibacter aquimaris]